MTAVPEGVSVGRRAPDFTLSALDGSQISLSRLRGKTILINFWATWCPPCREEMPALNDLYQRQRDQGFLVLAANLGEDPETAAAFVRKGGYTFPVVLDRATEVGSNYQAIALPTSYLIDSEGIVRDRIIGAMTAEVMQAKAQRFIGASSQAPPQPGSVVQAAGAANERAVATLGDGQITMGDVNHRVDVLLALDRLESGAVLDPMRPADQAELKQRQKYALDDLIDRKLLADAARRDSFEAEYALADHELVTLASERGGSDALASELAKHGVTVEDLRALLEEITLTGAYVEEVIAAAADSDLPAAAVRQWLEAERSRRGVRTLQILDR